MTYIHNGILFDLISQWNIIYQERGKKMRVTVHGDDHVK